MPIPVAPQIESASALEKGSKIITCAVYLGIAQIAIAPPINCVFYNGASLSSETIVNSNCKQQAADFVIHSDTLASYFATVIDSTEFANFI